MSIALFTISDDAYSDRVGALVSSLRAVGHDEEFYWFCICGPGEMMQVPAEWGVTIVPIADLKLPEQYFFRYDIIELATSIKPMALLHVLEWHDAALYLDPDMYAVGHLGPLLSMVKQSDVTLVPHVTAEDHSVLQYGDFARIGICNGGIVGARSSVVARDALKWWQTRLRFDCLRQQEAGIFLDQRWLDFLPAMFPGVEFCRDRRFNAAWWNSREELLQSGNLALFHFSGFKKERFPLVTTHVRALHVGDLGPAHQDLFVSYIQALQVATDALANRPPPSGGILQPWQSMAFPLRALYRRLGEPSLGDFRRIASSGQPTLYELFLRETFREVSHLSDAELMDWYSVDSSVNTPAGYGSFPKREHGGASPISEALPLWERCSCGAPKPGRYS